MQEDLIGQQIQELSHKQHIDDVAKIKEHQYQLAYSPQLTNSPYSHLTFTLIITLPPHYPEDPPALNFLDKIYHLNIDPTTGEVHMPILSDDWSPFLTLAAVLDSLDNLLEEPDKDYAASEVLLQEYLNQPERYLHRIEQTIKATSDDFILMNNSQSVVEHVEIIADSKLNEKILSNSLSESQESNQFKNSQDLFEIAKQKGKQLKKSTTREEAIKIETLSNSPSQYLPQSEDNLVAKEINNEKDILSKISKKSQAPVEIPTSIQPPPNKFDAGGQSSRRAIKPTDNLQMASNSEFQKMHLSLRQADRMMQVLLGENDEMEQTLKRVGGSRLKEKLLEKQKRILQMIQQTLELSSSLREKLFERLKADTKSLLR